MESYAFLCAGFRYGARERWQSDQTPAPALVSLKANGVELGFMAFDTVIQIAKGTLAQVNQELQRKRAELAGGAAQAELQAILTPLQAGGLPFCVDEIPDL